MGKLHWPRALRLPARARRLSRRVAIRGSVLTAVAVAGGIWMAAPAQAISLFGSCTTPPTPQLPGTGLSGWIAGRHAQAAPAGNPFAAHPTATEYQQYGYAGLSWDTYDLGCTNALTGGAADPGPHIDTLLGDWLLGGAKTIVAADNAIHSWAVNSAWASSLNPVVTTAEHTMNRDLFAVWAGVAITSLALTLLWRSHRGDFATALSSVGWALAVLALTGACYAFPLAPGHYAAEALSSTIGALDAGFVGQDQASLAAEADAHASLMESAVLYPAWAEGEFGSASSATARTYGPQLFEDQALTWRQAAGSAQQITAAEQAEESKWSAAAAQVKKADGVAYGYLQGNSGSRIGVGTQAIGVAVIVSGFDIFCSMVVVIAILMVMMTVVLLPGLAVVGLHHDMRHLITGALSRAAGWLWGALLWAVAGGIDAAAARVLLAHNYSYSVMPFFVLLVLPIALFVMVRKYRAGRVVPRALLAAAGLVGLRGVTRRGAAAGARQALEETHHHHSAYTTYAYHDGRSANFNFWGFPFGGGGGQWGGTVVPPPAGPLGGGGGGGLPAAGPPGLPGGGGGGGGGAPPVPPAGGPAGGGPGGAPPVAGGPGATSGGGGGGGPSWPNRNPGWGSGGGTGPSAAPSAPGGARTGGDTDVLTGTVINGPGGTGGDALYDGGPAANTK